MSISCRRALSSMILMSRGRSGRVHSLQKPIFCCTATSAHPYDVRPFVRLGAFVEEYLECQICDPREAERLREWSCPFLKVEDDKITFAISAIRAR